ncbi:hypothetical protein M6D93_09520 [Jatrophihabitans telluris]|uniref:Uncharacterized protein n=1 Tax=Jatrophihabitans telluris TaxID=2038343 RepID=A0ABY4R3E3_9ACTN|nr:hypothetical protein [Jatrophihabitans telluris]UQX90220.1 hypothetical protein M6D93_09520 [Jatrophihabitans telluris]
MLQRRCAQLAAWGTAWLQGRESFDSVLDAATGHGRPLPGPGFDATLVTNPVGAALFDLRAAGARSLRLVLPVAGDVRGLAGDPAFRDAALGAGEATFGGEIGLTCVAGPQTPSSAGPELRWWRTRALPANPDYLSVPDAEHDLTEAIRETASALADRGRTSWLADVAPALSNARRAGEKLNLPASHPPRAVRVIAQAERLSAVLTLVDSDDTGTVTAADVADRAAILKPLRMAVRRALLAGYNAGAEVNAQ